MNNGTTHIGRPRVLVAKIGLDGHDRGAKVVAMHLRDAGYEVIYLGIRQSPEQIAAVAVSEDVDLVGLSILSGAHSLLIPAVVHLLREDGLDAPVVVGGIIPQADRSALREAGVARIFGPGDALRDIVSAIDSLLAVPASADR
jgi:methylmalonyl-CoA mutase C-terminal domain/subunit